MEADKIPLVLEEGVLWTGESWGVLPRKKGKTVLQLAKEARKLLASGMAAKDIIPYMSRDEKAK